jgi:integrase
MPRLTRSIPSYRKHKASGQAVVTLGGRDFYLGPYGSSISRKEYDRLVSHWLQQGRQTAPTSGSHDDPTLYVTQLIVCYLQFAHGYYRKHDRLTSEYTAIIHALRHVKRLYGHRHASEFGPIALQSVIQSFVAAGWARGTINKQLSRVKRMFRWGVSQELVSAAIYQALSAVDGLRRGRTNARESRPVLPVDEITIDATIPYLPEVVGDMVRLQQWTGMRPAEICLLRPMDVDRTGDVWIYRPESHKTEHHGRDRLIYLGPQAQGTLLRYLARDAMTYCFRPCDSEAKRRAAQHAARKTPLFYGNRPGTNRRAKPHVRPGERYSTNSYRHAIHRACDSAFRHPRLASVSEADLSREDVQDLSAWRSEHRWSPNQLRHLAATRIRREFGLEAAQVTLGHAHAAVTEIYAEKDRQKGIEVARRIG